MHSSMMMSNVVLGVSTLTQAISEESKIASIAASEHAVAADGYVTDNAKVYVAEDFSEDENGAKLDIGGASTAKIIDMIREARTVMWNGTLGMVEDPRFARSSHDVAVALGSSDAKTIVGGGDTTGFVESVLKDEPDLTFDLVSTGGGASLELLSGKKLPGLEILEDR